MQRLFSTFANSWPGFGLLVQRLTVGTALIWRALAVYNVMPQTMNIAPQIVEAVLGLFILAGFWTPIAGALIAAVEIWIALAGRGDAWVSIILAILGGTLAMIGPGAWSIDARLFGRKQIPS